MFSCLVVLKRIPTINYSPVLPVVGQGSRGKIEDFQTGAGKNEMDVFTEGWQIKPLKRIWTEVNFFCEECGLVPLSNGQEEISWCSVETNSIFTEKRCRSKVPRYLRSPAWTVGDLWREGRMPQKRWGIKGGRLETAGHQCFGYPGFSVLATPTCSSHIGLKQWVSEATWEETSILMFQGCGTFLTIPSYVSRENSWPTSCSRCIFEWCEILSFDLLD